MSADQELLISSSPHASSEENIPRIMWGVVIALVPAAAMSVYFFGWRALVLYAVSIATAEAAEVACLYIREKPLEWALDGSAFVTGALLAMVIPPSVEWFVPVVGSAFAVCIAKHCFGGLGCNIWNPALTGRIFLQFAYPAQISLSEWTVPRLLFDTSYAAVDGTTAATPLYKEAVQMPGPSYMDLLMGNGIGGCLGETCKLAIIAGGVFLIIRRYIDWRVPFFYIATVFALTGLLPTPADAPYWMTNPLYHVLSGGLMFGAFFMATDMVTTPLTQNGRIVFAVGCGILVSIIRFYGGYPEGVAYSIVLMNTATPLIDRWVQPNVFGSLTLQASERQP